MTLPYKPPLTRRNPSAPVIPEPARPGDPGGPPCRICTEHNENDAQLIWRNEHWALRNPGQTSLPGAVWLSTWDHFDSFQDLPPERAAEFGPLVGRIERAILARGGVGRVHVYRWGDGGAHFHVWLVPRPLGMLEASREMLMLWEDVLPPATPEQLAEAGRDIAKELAQA